MGTFYSMIDGLKYSHGEIGDNGKKWMGKRDKLCQSDELYPNGCSVCIQI